MRVCQLQGKVCIGLLVFGSGNPLIWGGAWWFNRQRKGMQAQWENQKRLEQLKTKEAAIKKGK